MKQIIPKETRLENQDGHLVQVVVMTSEISVSRLRAQIAHQQEEKEKAIAVFDIEIARLEAVIAEAGKLGIDISQKE